MSQPLTIRGKGDGVGTLVVVGGDLVGSAKLPKMAPFEGTEVLFSSFGPLAIEQVDGAPEIVFGQRLESGVDLGGISTPADLFVGEFCLLTFLNGSLFVGLRLFPVRQGLQPAECGQ